MRLASLFESVRSAISSLALVPCLIVLALGSAKASPIDDTVPAASNVMGAEYPRIHPDLTADFRLKAPTAQSVQVQVGADQKHYDLTKGADGVWTGTTPPLIPGFHYYYFFVDGVQVNDPASHAFYGVSKDSSGIEVPDKNGAYFQPQQVPHGDVRTHFYYSKITESWRRCFVYTPPDYDKQVSERFPVLYLQHGSGEDETGWIAQGHANFIVDNLIAARKAKSMIIVMDRGYALKPGEPPPPSPGAPRPSNQTGVNPSRFATFEQVVVTELIPMIDSTYRTIADRDHRALAGLSMGGAQTFEIGLHHLDQFAYLGGFSGSGGMMGGAPLDIKTSYGGVLANSDEFNHKVKLVWMGLGTVEPERIATSVKGFHEALDKAGIKTVFYESPGTAHEWLTWRRSLDQFAPLLFR